MTESGVTSETSRELSPVTSSQEAYLKVSCLMSAFLWGMSTLKGKKKQKTETTCPPSSDTQNSCRKTATREQRAVTMEEENVAGPTLKAHGKEETLKILQNELTSPDKQPETAQDAEGMPVKPEIK